jgi:hypothetical protein
MKTIDVDVETIDVDMESDDDLESVDVDLDTDDDLDFNDNDNVRDALYFQSIAQVPILPKVTNMGLQYL